MTCGPSRNVFVFLFGGICAPQHHRTRLSAGAVGPQTLLSKHWGAGSGVRALLGRGPAPPGGTQARLPSTAHCSLPVPVSLCPCPCQGPSGSQEAEHRAGQSLLRTLTGAAWSSDTGPGPGHRWFRRAWTGCAAPGS